MQKIRFSSKRIAISKANATIVAVVAGAAFITVFGVVASKSLLDQRSYQARVISGKEKAKRQLKDNLQAVEGLKLSYQEFVGSPINMLGGNPSGNGAKDGDNAKLVLDALPSEYDFPALATSLEKILTDKNYKIVGISGTDDQLAQHSAEDNFNPEPVAIPFEIAVSGSYGSMDSLVSVLQRSIRPIQIKTLIFSGADNDIRMTMTAESFYQPAKVLGIKSEVVR